MSHVVVCSRATCAPPSWALWERFLIDKMNEAAPAFEERYTRRDGTFVWRDKWPGFDGSDDGYESYHNWPLFYVLGGSADIHERSRYLWEAVTRQFTAYGQIYRAFDANYDWMHHGESSIYFYYFGLADPTVLRDRARALRFAGLYMGEDAEAQNWDAERRMIRSPINGSRGPRFENAWDDWVTHRPELSYYPAPFEDIPGVDGPIADWMDDRVYGEILRLLNQRQMRCDVPLNLTCTSLITNAYLYTGDDRYRQWVLDYVEAWGDRIAANGGICPDNVGPNGIIGETMDGKWWGGYYGWRWPHGFMSIIQPLVISATNAVLLTGDMGYLDMPRGQLDRIMNLSHEEGGVLLAPNRHMDGGWCDYRPIRPEYPIQVWYVSQAEADRARLARFPERLTTWTEVKAGRGSGDNIHIAPWYRYLEGANPDYPIQIAEAQWNELARRMDGMAHDDGDPQLWNVHHWQDINPVHTEALVQLTCGGPQIIYRGGLLHVHLRHFDLDKARPGLPTDVGALVESLGADSTTVTLVNTSPRHPRRLIVQAGAFGEHLFSQVTDLAVGEDQRATLPINHKHLEVHLAPSGMVRLELQMRRYCSKPTYDQPV